MGILRALLVGLMLACVAAPAWAAPPAPGEYQVKAVFLFNFAQFVDWPAEALATPGSPFTICVLGEDPFGDQLDTAVRGESVQGHPLAIERHAKPEGISACQILFIGATESGGLDAIDRELQGRAVLTVSDIDRAAERGVIIQFANENNRLHLRINVQKAKAAGLTLSSKLLRPAEIVAQSGGTG